MALFTDDAFAGDVRLVTGPPLLVLLVRWNRMSAGIEGVGGSPRLAGVNAQGVAAEVDVATAAATAARICRPGKQPHKLSISRCNRSSCHRSS